MMNFFSNIKNIDNSIIRIMKSGFRFSFILCLFFTYILFLYTLNPVSHVAFAIGYLGVKCGLMFFVCFFVCAFATDQIRKSLK